MWNRNTFLSSIAWVIVYALQLFLENILSGGIRTDGSINLLVSRVVFKNRCASKPKQLGLWEKVFDCFVVFSKL